MRKYFLICFICAFVFGSVLFGLNESATAADKPKYGGTLNVIHGKGASSIGDPLKIVGWNHEYVDFVLNTLITPSNKNLGTFDPTLVTGWKLSPDRKYYDFTVKKGIKFHDGTDFNAQAIKWNIDRWVGSGRPRLSAVTSVEIIDENTVRCNLSAWKATVLFDFAKDSFMISPTAFEKNGAEWAENNPVGTGAFKMIEYKRNVAVKYEKNKDYFEAGLPYLDNVVITTIADPMTATASLKTGENDAWYGVDSITGSEFKQEGKFVLLTNPGPKAVLQFNSEDPSSPWAKKEVREALEYAIDKASISKAVGKGFSYPVYDIIHSIPPKAGTIPRKYDPAKAKELMQKAGYPNGIKTKMSYQSTRGNSDAIVAIQANLAAIGIEIVPEPVTGAAFNELLFKPVAGHDLILGNERGGPNELLVSVDETLGKGSIFFQGVKKPEGFYSILETALQQEKLEDTLNNLYKLEKLAYDEAMFVPLWGALFITVQAPYVKDAVWYWGSMPYPKLQNAWLDK
jgi:ABC-type transport system substrate-binding protein